MEKEELIKRWKKYCEFEFANISRFNYDPYETAMRCHGAMNFLLLNLGKKFDNEILGWWEKEMLPRFKTIEKRK